MDPPPWALCYSQAGPSPCTWWCWASLSLLVWKGICTTSLEEKTLVYPAWRSVPIGAYCSVTRVLSGCRVPLFVSLNTEGIEVACDIKSWWWDSNRVPWSPENGSIGRWGLWPEVIPVLKEERQGCWRSPSWEWLPSDNFLEWLSLGQAMRCPAPSFSDPFDANNVPAELRGLHYPQVPS